MILSLADLSHNAGITKANLLEDWMLLGFYVGLEHSQLEPSHDTELDAVDDFMMKRNSPGLSPPRF